MHLPKPALDYTFSSIIFMVWSTLSPLSDVQQRNLSLEDSGGTRPYNLEEFKNNNRCTYILCSTSRYLLLVYHLNSEGILTVS